MALKSLGDYAILKLIGHGALGAVYLGEHRFLKKPFALKLLPEEFSADPDFLKRFEEEVALMALLDHPNLVKVHNVSESKGRYFLVSDPLTDATPLADFLKAHPAPLDEKIVSSIALQIGSALEYLHQRPVKEVHRAHSNLKLGNVFINRKGEAVLTDFGLTRIVGKGVVIHRVYKAISDLLSSTTGFVPFKKEDEEQQHSFIQNYAFLAPELKMGDLFGSSEVKADIYAFGVLIYYLIARRYPEGVFPWVSELAPHYQKDWDGLLKACLQNDPSRRAASMGEVLKFASSSLKPSVGPGEINRPQFDADPAAIFQIDHTVGRYQAQPKQDLPIEPLQSKMVVISSGVYERGSQSGGRDEIPRHEIQLSAFAIDVHPVTNEQFVRFLEAMGGEKDAQHNDLIRLRESRIKRGAGKLSIESGYSRHPVVGVTWYGALSYAKWVGKRLPTEAEWEVAARGGVRDAIYPTGATIERTEANFFSSDTTPVMSYPANGYGLFDMAGNVYEWCHDWYDYHYYDLSVQEPKDPKGPHQGVYRVLRGGCWRSLPEDLRCSHRHRNNPGTMNGTYGFRCAADVV